MLKLFLLGAARPAFTLLNASGLLAALVPGLVRRLRGNDDHLNLLDTNLEGLDRLSRSGLKPSPALFLATLFGPALEEEALARHLNGVPHQQALETVCALFLEELCKTVTIPGRIGGQLRRILAFQPSLNRMPPRRPAALTGRPDFADAMAYLCLIGKTRKDHQTAREWWKNFLKTSSAIRPEPSSDPPPVKKRRKRRHRRRPSTTAA
jgi:poly(A) polymerase